MDKDKRITRQGVKGIIDMVFDVFESEQKGLPNTYDFYQAILNWIEYEKTPNKEMLNEEKDTP
jgi:hypothetical protein